MKKFFFIIIKRKNYKYKERREKRERKIMKEEKYVKEMG